MFLARIKLYRRISGIKFFLKFGFRNSIKINYFYSNNFGDALNPILMKFLGVKSVANIPTEFYKKEHLQVIGSIIQVCNEGTTVWGSGFISRNTEFYYSPPKKVLAVRGPETREKLKEMGVDCPEVYGDPALLFPIFYNKPVNKLYKVGIVPHYSNFNDPILSSFNENDTLIIDVMDSNPLNVIDKIRSCELILSSSLHGIIIGDAYQIPSYWVEFSKKVGVDNFKFKDYFKSVNRNTNSSILMENLSLDCLNNLPKYTFDFNPIPLLKAFPLGISEDILSKAKKYYRK